MKLASLKSGRDGQLVVVNRNLSAAVKVPQIANTLQQALDDWQHAAPALHAVYDDLNNGSISDCIAFHEADCHCPLPRAYQWADGSAYVNHVRLVRQARNAEMPDSFWTDPLMYQGGSDDFIPPQADIELGDPRWGIDFEAEIAVITDDVAMAVSPAQAAQHIQLLMLVNDVSLRSLIPAELAKGFGFFQSKPASSFSPLAITPDELGSAWIDNRVHLPLYSTLNGEIFGCPNAGVDMTFNFAELIAHAAKTRKLRAGTIIGSGTVSNQQALDKPSTVAAGGVGYSCIAELRMIETIRDGQASTNFMQFGDHIRIEMFANDGLSLFGAIDQRIVHAHC